jgi:aminoglycoside 6'-N-acetyltransferase
MLLYRTYEITVRKLEMKDEELLVSWLSNPKLLEYYEGRDRPHDVVMVRKHFYMDDDETRCIFEYHRKPIGYIQFYQLEEESRNEYGYNNSDVRIYGMDQFIGETEYWNKGIGTKLVKSMIDYLINYNKADKIVMDPQAWNERAIACYEKCGFKKVKLLKEHEKHEGRHRDCWLIEYSPES